MTKANTGLITVIVIMILIIAGLAVYLVMVNNDKNVTNSTTTEDITQTKDVTGSYYGSYSSIDEETTITDEYRLEIKFDNNGNVKIVKSDISDDVVKGTYTVSGDTIYIVTTDKDYTLTYIDDNTLEYNDIDRTITLNKSDDLKYIK